MDNDCNGRTDSADADLETTACGNQVGLCGGAMHSRARCSAGEWQPCTPSDYRSNDARYGAEVCDGEDNDCDGEVDEAALGVALARPCYTGVPAGTEGVGVCRGGTEACSDGGWAGVCVGEVLPGVETCNGVDDDCDGVVDDGDPGSGGACDTGEAGVCAAGAEHCSGGRLVCLREQEPAAAEQCDGEDDDCDGEVDEGDPGGGGQCATGDAACPAGRWRCVEGGQRCLRDAGVGWEQCALVATWCGPGVAGPPCNSCPVGTVVPAGFAYVPTTGPAGFVMGSPGPECDEGCACGGGDGECLDPRCPDSCPGAEPGRSSSNDTQHRVVITRPYLLKATEVTQGEWAAFARDLELEVENPSYFPGCGEGCPVDRVDWYESVRYANWLSEREGLDPCYEPVGPCNEEALGQGCDPGNSYCNQGDGTYVCADVRFAGLDCPGYRLPTEAEWEWAARAGTYTAFHNGEITNTGCDPSDPVLDESGWYCGNSDTGGGRRTHPVADTDHLPEVCNAWGLCDMHGNVAEWLWDRKANDYGGLTGEGGGPVVDPLGGENAHRVYRGGSSSTGALFSRAAYRGSIYPSHRYGHIGLRPSLTFPAPERRR